MPNTPCVPFHVKDGKYLQAFALNTEIGVTVQLLEMAAGVRACLDIGYCSKTA